MQEEIDNMYIDVCNIYYDEMDKWFRFNNINNCLHKKFRNSSKPYWNENLSELWREMCLAEANYLKAPKKHYF